jgi:hypothetical protein
VAGNRFTGQTQLTDLGRARGVAAGEQAGASAALAAQRRRVQLEDGSLVEAEEGPDGRLRVVPIRDPSGSPVRGVRKQASEPREFARGASPRSVQVQRFNWHLENPASGERHLPAAEQRQKALQKAKEAVDALFGPGWDQMDEAGPAPGQPQGQPQGHPAPAAARDPKQEALDALDLELTAAVRQRPDLEPKLRAAAEKRRKAILGAQ